MIVLALALLIIVLVFSLAIVLSNPDVYQLSLFRILVPVTSAGVFFTGFGAALLTITALLLLRTGSAVPARPDAGCVRPTRPVWTAPPARPEAARALTETRTSPPNDPPTRTQPSEATRPPGARTRARATQRLHRPHRRPPASSLDLEPGEDSTTSPVDRRGTSDVADRDEPRTCTALSPGPHQPLDRRPALSPLARRAPPPRPDAADPVSEPGPRQPPGRSRRSRPRHRPGCSARWMPRSAGPSAAPGHTHPHRARTPPPHSAPPGQLPIAPGGGDQVPRHHGCGPSECDHHRHHPGHQHRATATLVPPSHLAPAHRGAVVSGSGTTWARAWSGTTTNQSASGRAATRTVTVTSEVAPAQ